MYYKINIKPLKGNNQYWDRFIKYFKIIVRKNKRRILISKGEHVKISELENLKILERNTFTHIIHNLY